MRRAEDYSLSHNFKFFWEMWLSLLAYYKNLYVSRPISHTSALHLNYSFAEDSDELFAWIN